MAQVDFYVDTDVAGGDTTGRGSSGSPWSTLQYAIENTSGGIKSANNYLSTDYSDCVTQTSNLVIHCQGSAEEAHTGMSLFGYTTSSDYDIVIKAQDGHRHGGSWNTGTYRMRKTNTGGNALYLNGVKYITIDGLQIDRDTDVTSATRGIYTAYAGTDSQITLKNNIFRNTGTGTPSAAGDAIYVQDEHNLAVVNNIIYGGSWYDGIQSGTCSTAITRTYYNNTIYGCVGYGINPGGATATPTVRIFNNICDNNTLGDYPAFDADIVTDTNGSGDTSSPDGASYQSLTFPWVSTTDFTLTAATSPAGTDMSSDGSYSFSDDINGDARSSWDLGADEAVAINSVSSDDQVSPTENPWNIAGSGFGNQ